MITPQLQSALNQRREMQEELGRLQDDREERMAQVIELEEEIYRLTDDLEHLGVKIRNAFKRQQEVKEGDIVWVETHGTFVPGWNGQNMLGRYERDKRYFARVTGWTKNGFVRLVKLTQWENYLWGLEHPDKNHYQGELHTWEERIFPEHVRKVAL